MEEVQGEHRASGQTCLAKVSLNWPALMPLRLSLASQVEEPGQLERL